jgi:ribosomal protein L31E
MNNLGDLIDKKQSVAKSAQKQLQQIRELIVDHTKIEPVSIGVKDNQLNIKVVDSMQANELRLHQTELLEFVQQSNPTIKTIRTIVSTKSS